MKKKYSKQHIILKSYGFDEKKSSELLQKYNGNIQKVLYEYESNKSFPKIKKLIEKKVISNKEEKSYPKQEIILKSYGFDEKKSSELLQKYEGNIQKVLFEYYSFNKPKDLLINCSINE